MGKTESRITSWLPTIHELAAVVIARAFSEPKHTLVFAGSRRRIIPNAPFLVVAFPG